MSLYSYAVKYGELGLPIFPCQPRGKEPACSRGVRDATSDLGRIRSWWSECNDLNIGLACGEPSGLFVIDVDGAEGETTLDKLEQKHGTLPPTREVITGRDGGRHLYYRIGPHKVGNSAAKLGPGLDVRGEGGYVLVYPSIHPTGRLYRFSVDSADHIAAAPDWLLALIAENRSSQGRPLEHWHRVLTEQISNGNRNSTLTSVCGKLLRSGLNDLVLLLDVMRCVNLARCEEPLSEDEVHGVVASVARTHLKRLRGDA